MKPMSPFEVRANNIEVAISAARERVKDFGYEDDPPEETVSRIIGMFVTWLTACEEARLNKPFTEGVIKALPQTDDPNWQPYIQPPPSSTLRQRAEALWGIRIAFTHADGDTGMIENLRNRTYAEDAAKHIPGVVLGPDKKLRLGMNVCHTAARTIVQVQDVIRR